jgi:threonine/homoserine/homoserine lactone efflux protein
VVSIGAVAGVALIALGLVLTPGPNMIYLVSRSLSQGRAAGLVSLAGVACGFLVYLVATSIGLAALFAAVPALFVIVKLAGAAYLLYLAWSIVRPGGRNVFAGDHDQPGHSTRRLFAMGLATCLLNPKIALMYAALLPQFVDPSAGPTAVQLLQLGLVQVVVAVTVNAAWVVAAAWVAALLHERPLAQRVQRWLTASVLGGFAVHLGTTS